MESVVLTDWSIAARSWRGRGEGDERMQSSAQPLASDSWQLHFMQYQVILEGLVVRHAVSCPSLSDQVIR